MFIVNKRSFTNKILNRLEIKAKRIRMRSRPVELTLEPTLKCNSNCVMCNRNFSRAETKQIEGFLSWKTFQRAEPFFRYAERVLFGGFGESLLHPDYTAMIRDIKKSGPFVYFFTNGILMTEVTGRKLADAGMDMICISMGGATRETYRKIRGVDAFDTVVDNIRRISEYRKQKNKGKPILSFNVVAMNSLLPELEQLVRLAHEIGVSKISFPNMVVQGPDIEDESIWLKKGVATRLFAEAGRLANSLGILFIPPNLNVCTNHCFDLFNRLTINWDGTVMSCAMERYIVGNLKETTIGQIWNSEGMIKLRKDYYSLGLERLCPNCTCWDNRPGTFLKPSVNSRKYAQRV